MMAGDVGVAIIDGVVHIKGGSANNSVLVNKRADGGVDVVGLSNTTVNGSNTFSSSKPVHSLDVNLAGGNDTLQMSPNAQYWEKDITVDMFTGRDTVSLESVQISGKLTIRTSGGGNDSVTVNRGEVTGVLTIDTAEDSDFVSVRETKAAALDIDTGSQNPNGKADVGDTLDLLALEVGQLRIATGDGQDVVGLVNSQISDRLSIDTGRDRDSVYLNDVDADELFVNLGSGAADLLDMKYSSFGSMELHGGGGSEDLVRVFDCVYGSVEEDGFEVYDL
jgi:hypothetical protein